MCQLVNRPGQIHRGMLQIMDSFQKRPQRQFPLFGIPITDATLDEALALLDAIIDETPPRMRRVYFANAHTINLACDNPGYHKVLRTADYVFGDGTGVRWATRALHQHRIRDNVNGTDLIPQLLRSHHGTGRRFYLLGSQPDRIARAAAYARRHFPNWTLTGYHHGFLDSAASARVVEQINATAPHVLLVGMGNPTQELWIHRHRNQLRVPVCLGVGGLFEYWSGELVRAPTWLRGLGHEWVNILVRQPHKARRYLLGNPRFLLRIAQTRLRDFPR